MITKPEKLDPATLGKAAAALKRVAADPRCREAFRTSLLPRELFSTAAGRYVVAAGRDDLVERLSLLMCMGYRVSAEHVGEEAEDLAQIRGVVDEYLALFDTAGRITRPEPIQIGFDLTNVGLLRSKRLAKDHTSTLLTAAAAHGITIVISMERARFVDDILDVFKDLAEAHENVGITVQAHLHRTDVDLPDIIKTERKIRLVKGVYREPADVAVPPGPRVTARYLRFLEQALDAEAKVALGTHDGGLLATVRERGLLAGAEEIEMLHGVRPELLKAYRAAGVPCRVYAVYGDNWWLHFLHRLAERPQRVLTALADLEDPGRVVFGSAY
ncbi:MAG TPA: proline dehydrogenase family protein [Nonomuraea sp.]|nr:proline dehydrogenase family protein [Nonomuraea sp.]